MRTEQSVGSYPTPRRTYITADNSPRSEDFSDSVILVWPAIDQEFKSKKKLWLHVDTAVNTDRSCCRRSFRTFEFIILSAPAMLLAW